MKGLRVGLCTLFAFCVLAHGAVEVWSLTILEAGSAALLLVWAICVYRDAEEKVFWNVLNWPLLGFIAIGLFQLLFHGTLYPFLTETETLKLVAYFIVFFLTAQVFRNRSSLEGLAWFLILLCFAVSLLGIVQHFTSEDKIYWFREPAEGGAVFGPYVNRNHFAGFVELVLPVGLALMAFRGLRRELFPLATVLTVIPVSALILSGSRGGIIGFAFEVGVLILLVRNRRSARGPHMAGVAIVVLAALALIAWVGAGKAIERLSTLKPSEVTLDRRVSMFRGTIHVFYDHPIKGSGLGTLVAAYPRYETSYDGRVVDHAHNDYAETLADTGLLGGLCGMVFLWLLYREAQKNFEAEQGHFSRGLHAAAIVALSGMLLHSFLDFNLHIPSNALLFLLQAYIVTTAPLPTEAHNAPRRRRE